MKATESSEQINEEELAKTVEQSVNTIVTIGEKVQKIVAAYSTAAATSQYTTAGAQQPESWSDSVKSKLDTTIKVLDAVKKELDEEQPASK